MVSKTGQDLGVCPIYTVHEVVGSAWPVVLEAVHRLFPDLPVFGYEHDDALEAAIRHGFEPIGPLRVWPRRLVLGHR